MSEPSEAKNPPRDFRVATPGQWMELDLDPATSANSIRAMVERRAGVAVGHSEPARRLTAVLRDATATAVDQGAVYAALYSDDLEGRVVSASLIGAVAPIEDRYGDASGADLASLAVDLVERFEAADARVVELPAGPAVRLARRWTAPVLGRSAEVAGVQYFVPIPCSRHLVMLNFSTPTVGLAAAFAELFDAIAESLRWRW